jgi:hypothetical protein
MRGATWRAIVAAVTILAALVIATTDASGAGNPTCAAQMGIAVHGEHIIGDYVTGLTPGGLDWPPKGGVVGQAIAGEGVVVPGGPGPGFHFAADPPFAPGASFCNGSNSPGAHI